MRLPLGFSCTVDLSNTGSTSSMDTKKAISTSNSCRNNKPLRRGRQQASTADGISWDMEEDAIEEGENVYDSFLKNLRPCIRESLDGKTWREPNAPPPPPPPLQMQHRYIILIHMLPSKEFKLHFFFAQNPYLKNTVVNKTNHMIEEDDSILEKAIGTEIAWCPIECLDQKTWYDLPQEQFYQGQMEHDYDIGFVPLYVIFSSLCMLL
ncbi:hypothetical protein HID58_079256 [Brassica napus]|uniref:Uncharacterized protein n=1 Tax=Brassica napus TaxID=3708 RepID=A0ABQ7Y1H5_BRANA|nr:hypothetical protein HID58_079256 [Brassica napus]